MLACAASAGLPLYATQDASEADLPAGTHLVGRLPVDPGAPMPPAAFAVDASGQAVVLLPSPPRLVRLRASGAPHVPLLLRGEDFPAASVGPVDLLLRPNGEYLVLDSGVGTLWRVGPDGSVRSRHGHFVAPTRVRAGGGDRVLVADPGSASVVVLGPDLEVAAVRRGEDLGAVLTEDSGVPFLRLRPDGSGAQLGLVPLQGATPSTERLAVLPPPPGYQLMTAEVLAGPGPGLTVLTGSAPLEGEGSRFRLHRVPRDGELPPPVTIPWLPSGCLDCGPTYRFGADGRLYGYLLRRDLYRIVRVDTEEDQG